MTIQGAIAELQNLINADDVPFYYKGGIQKVIETIQMDLSTIRVSDDCISRQAVLDFPIRLDHYDKENGNEHFVLGIESVMEYVESLPPVETKRPKGEWVDYTEDGYVECPFCHSATTCDGNKDELHFCFSCGADMKGADDETD